MEESMWNSKMATVYYGMCHTFLYPDKLEADMINDGLLFFLEPTINYRIIFHDPKFYHMVSNTFTFPRIWLEYKVDLNMKSDYFDWYYISVTEHHLLNRPEQPCEEKEDYDFLKCVKTSQAESVGCRPPWDIWSPHTIPLCQTVVQLQQHERLDWLDINYEQKMIINNTGCLVPCKYKVSNIQKYLEISIYTEKGRLLDFKSKHFSVSYIQTEQFRNAGSLISGELQILTSCSFCNDMVVYFCFVSLADTTKI